MISKGNINSLGGAAAPATSLSSTDFPFTFDTFMENFNGWSASTTSSGCTVKFSGSDRTQPNAGPFEHSSVADKDAQEECNGSFGFLFGTHDIKRGDVENPAFSTFSDNANDNPSPFFETGTSDAIDAKGDRLNFDFSSLFFNRCEGTEGRVDFAGDAETKVKEMTRDNEGEAKHTTQKSDLAPFFPLNNAGQSQQVTDSTQQPQNADHPKNTTHDPRKAPAKVTHPSLPQAMPPPATSSQQVAANGEVRNAVCVDESDRSDKKALILTPDSVAKQPKTIPFSEITLSAALAASSTVPRYTTSLTRPGDNTMECAAPEPLNATSEDENEHEGEERQKAIQSSHSVKGSESKNKQHVCNADGGHSENEEGQQKVREGGFDKSSEDATKANEERVVTNPAATPGTRSADSEGLTSKAADLLINSQNTCTAHPYAVSQLPSQTHQGKLRGFHGVTDDSASAAASHAALTNLIGEAKRACARAAAVEVASRTPLFTSFPSSPHHQCSRKVTGPALVHSSTHSTGNCDGSGLSTCTTTNNRTSTVAALVGGAEDTKADATTSTSDAVFFAEVAQLQKQSARLSEETAKSAAAFQSQTGDLLRLLGPHVSLASLVGEDYAATPVVHLAPYIISLLEDLLKDNSEEEADQEEEKAIENELISFS